MKLCVMAMRRKFEFRVAKTSKDLFCVACIDKSCHWTLQAVSLKGSEMFMIRKYMNIHSCSIDQDHRQARSWVVGGINKEKV